MDKNKSNVTLYIVVRISVVYSRFSNAAGLRTENERLHVAGFGRGEAARASAYGKKQIALVESFKKTMSDAGYNVKGFDYYVGDAETLSQMQTAFTRMAKEFPEEAKGLTVQLSWSEDPDVIGWYDDKAKAIFYNRKMLKNWGDSQREYAALVKSGHFPAGTDARGCFYHEFGHALWSARGGGSLRRQVDSALGTLGYGHVNVAQRNEILKKVLSGYAAEPTHPAYQEVIAEALSEWYNSPKPRPFCKEFLKGVGIIGDV